MENKTTVRWLKRVDRPFTQVCEVFLECASRVFRSELDSSNADEPENPVVELQSDFGGIELRRDVALKINEIIDAATDSAGPMSIEFEWQAVESPGLFPKMKGTLIVRSFGDQTQLDFQGDYAPPFGIIGQTLDVMVGADVANSCVENFVSQIAERLCQIIPSDSTSVNKTN